MDRTPIKGMGHLMNKRVENYEYNIILKDC